MEGGVQRADSSSHESKNAQGKLPRLGFPTTLRLPVCRWNEEGRRRGRHARD